MGAIFDHLSAMYHECRAEYENYRESAYQAAEAGTGGAMLNARGRRAGIDPYSLTMGTEARAMAYASDELIEWWARHPRLTFEAFEHQWLANMQPF